MKIPWKKRIREDIERHYREKKENQKNLFKQKYNKPKVYKFPKASDINMNRFFCFPKFDEDFLMSRASIAIYPVLCLQSDYENNEWFQLSQKTIAIMSGVSINTVAKGIKDLEIRSLYEEPFLEKQKCTKGQRHFYVYKVNFIRKHNIEKYKGDYITFYKCIVDSGVWANLTLRAKALYLSMRMNSHFDVELYVDVEGLDLDYESPEVDEFYHSAEYRERKWDVCNTSLTELCRVVEITPINLGTVIDQLENHRLIERVDTYHNVFKVYLKPKI